MSKPFQKPVNFEDQWFFTKIWPFKRIVHVTFFKWGNIKLCIILISQFSFHHFWKDSFTFRSPCNISQVPISETNSRSRTSIHRIPFWMDRRSTSRWEHISDGHSSWVSEGLQEKLQENLKQDVPSVCPRLHSPLWPYHGAITIPSRRSQQHLVQVLLLLRQRAQSSRRQRNGTFERPHWKIMLELVTESVINFKGAFKKQIRRILKCKNHWES